MQGKRSSEDLILVGFVVVAALVRLLPHAPNFLPTTALVLFAGSQFENRGRAALVVFASLFLSDMLLGFHSTMPFVYGALFVILMAARNIPASPFATGKSSGKLLGITLGSSLFFFLVSNLGVFLVQDLYAKTFQGLVTCYVAAIPFFENSLMSDMVYTLALFGIWELVRSSSRVGSRTVPASL